VEHTSPRHHQATRNFETSRRRDLKETKTAMTQFLKTARYVKTNQSEGPAILFFALIIGATFLF
jgi:hypothetical protein